MATVSLNRGHGSGAPGKVRQQNGNPRSSGGGSAVNYFEIKKSSSQVRSPGVPDAAK